MIFCLHAPTTTCTRLLSACLCVVFSFVTQAQHEAILTFPDAPQAKTFVLSKQQEFAQRRLGSEAWVYQFRAESAGHLVYLIQPDPIRPQRPDISVKHDTPGGLKSRTDPNDPRYSEQWNLQQVNAPAAWQYTTGGRTVFGDPIVTGVIELDGFDFSNPELAPTLFTNVLEIPGNGVDDDNNGFIDDVNGYDLRNMSSQFEDNRHGTHVAGILGAATNNGTELASITWDATLLPFVIGSITQWTVAIDYYTALREQYNRSAGAEGAFIATINMSLGEENKSCDVEPEFNEAIDRAGRAGILSVGATDNVRGPITEAQPDFPSTCASEYLIVVTASDSEDQIFGDSRSSATHVDLAAPGSVLPTLPFGNLPASNSGTSMATPHVAATIALAYSLECEAIASGSFDNPESTAARIRDAVFSSVDPVDALRGLVRTDGRLNVAGALEEILLTSCLDGDVIVRFRENTSAAPPTFESAGIDYRLQRTLSDAWNIHLYQSSGVNVEDALRAVSMHPDVLSAEGNVAFALRTRVPRDPGYVQQDALAKMELPAAWETVYGATAAVVPSPVVTAVMDQNFDLASESLTNRLLVNSDEVAGNGIDDDANGYVDDRLALNLASRGAAVRSGEHGRIVTHLLAASADDNLSIAGVDWAGQILPIQGATLDQWIEAAAYVHRLRSEYNRSTGTSGALVVSLVLPQGAQRILIEGVNASLLEEVADALGEVGVLSLVAASNADSLVSSDIAATVASSYWLSVGGSEQPTSLPAAQIFAPSEAQVYDVDGSTSRAASGHSVSVAYAAGMLALAYQLPCRQLAAAAAQEGQLVAEEMQQSLLRASSSTSGPAFLNASILLAELGAACEATTPSTCQLYGASPNPLSATTSSLLRVGSTDENVRCEVAVFDMLGRELIRLDVSPTSAYQAIELRAQDWTQGLYQVRYGSDGNYESMTLMRQ